jgi:hypothetical protein
LVNLALPCKSDEDLASLLPSFTTPTKADCNDGACHAYLDAEGTKSEAYPNAKKEFNE